MSIEKQERSYHAFIQNFSSLFEEVSKEVNKDGNRIDKSICNAVVGFNTAKFLIERGPNRKKDEVYGVLKRELNKKAEQQLEDKAKEELRKYIRYVKDDEAAVKKVSIHGDHASIMLEDNKKKFQISEFLNSDFCQKNGISGFSTLHSDGKSGMHGFVSEGIRHYVVTDGSYEMTLKWYGEKGEEYEIKIEIDNEGVRFIEGNIGKDDKEQLKANKDVKIGGLFLHEIQFMDKARGNGISSEAATKIDVNNKDVGKGAGVQTSGQEHEEDDLAPLERLLKEIRDRSTQDNRGLKRIDPKARYISPQTRKHLIEAGLLQDDSTDVKRVAEREDTNLIVDKNSKLSKLLEKDAAQLKVGVIEEEREDASAEYINRYDRNRIALANRNRKLLWTKRTEQQDKSTKSI